MAQGEIVKDHYFLAALPFVLHVVATYEASPASDQDHSAIPSFDLISSCFGLW